MDPQQLVGDAALLAAFVEMVVMVVPDSLVLPTELAAFVVAQPDGTLTLVGWPMDGLRMGARYRGPIPQGVIALVHTHPHNRLFPSEEDFSVARRLSVPVIVLTRRGITVARPDDESPEWLLKDSAWVFTNRRTTATQLP